MEWDLPQWEKVLLAIEIPQLQWETIHRPSEILLQQWDIKLSQLDEPLLQWEKIHRPSEMILLRWDILRLQMQIFLQSYEHIISDYLIVSSRSESDDLEIR